DPDALTAAVPATRRGGGDHRHAHPDRHRHSRWRSSPGLTGSGPPPTPRDAFDIARIAEASAPIWTAPRTRAVVVALAGTLNHPFYKPGPRFRSGLTAQEVARHLHPMLVNVGRPEAEALMARATAAVEAIVLHPTEPEREYTERLQRGELRPDVLLPDEPELAARLAQHPALLWKAHNSREHHDGGGE
ncbi:MAG: hypothetical protein GY722_29250, partial [bacterium]|nr:hypothetical protein [bacterium]